MPDLVAAALLAGTFFAGEQPVLAGDGLVLRPWRAADADAVVRAYEDEGVRRWHVRTMDAREAADWIAGHGRRWRERTGVDWAVCEDDGVTVVGRIGIHRLVMPLALGEVVYWTLAQARGRRIAPRALSVLCDWAFTERGIHRLELVHSVHNLGSCRVAERCGFTLEGTMRGHLQHADGWHDMHLHARLAGDPAPR